MDINSEEIKRIIESLIMQNDNKDIYNSYDNGYYSGYYRALRDLLDALGID